jgi:hypothetical protein
MLQPRGAVMGPQQRTLAKRNSVAMRASTLSRTPVGLGSLATVSSDVKRLAAEADIDLKQLRDVKVNGR